jgi:hypothetical protein
VKSPFLAGRAPSFMASADPFGTNPFEECQMFSVDTVGGGLCQVTHLRPEDPDPGRHPGMFWP